MDFTIFVDQLDIQILGFEYPPPPSPANPPSMATHHSISFRRILTTPFLLGHSISFGRILIRHGLLAYHVLLI